MALHGRPPDAAVAWLQASEAFDDPLFVACGKWFVLFCLFVC